MKLVQSIIVAATLTTTGLLAGCSQQHLGVAGNSLLNETINSVADLSMPVKVNSTFTVTKLTKSEGAGVTLNLDLAKGATGSVDKYISSELQGQLANGVICSLPELKAGNTPVTLNIYQAGKFKKTVSKSSRYLCN